MSDPFERYRRINERQAYLQQQMPRNPTTAGGGVSALGHGLMMAINRRKLRKAQTAAEEEAARIEQEKAAQLNQAMASFGQNLPPHVMAGMQSLPPEERASALQTLIKRNLTRSVPDATGAQSDFLFDQARGGQSQTLNDRAAEGKYLDTAAANRANMDFPQPPAPAVAPTAVREYEYAKSQGFPGTFAEWKAQQRVSTQNVNDIGTKLGPIPQGHQVGPDGQMSPVPGSPAEARARQQQEAAATQQVAQERDTNVLTTDIGRALDLLSSPSLPTTGLGGSVLSNVPGTQAHDLQNLMESVKANVTFDRLNQMRAASTTGSSGLGQVTQTELGLLSNVLGSLEQSQSKDQFQENLERLRYMTNLVVYGQQEAARREEGYKAMQVQGSGDGEAMQLLNALKDAEELSDLQALQF